MKNLPLLLVMALAGAAAPSAAQTDPRMADLERKVEALAGEIERLKLGEAAEPELKSALGFGPAASKIYQKAPKRVSIGGYGEMIYENYQPKKQNGFGAGKRDVVDNARAILYVGYKFSDHVSFNSEVEFEHSGARVSGGGARGEVSLEMAALDFKPFDDRLGLRAGTLLMPVGLVNEVHEPTTFNGAKRPSVETNIIPTTWRENGAGLFGEWGPASYRSYVVSGLQAATDANVSGFTAASGLRSGRSSGGKSYIEDLAWVTRLDLSPAEGALVGGSLYLGEADQSQLHLPSVPVSLWEAHAKFSWRGAELRALYAQARVGNADRVNSVQGNAVGGTGSVGSAMFGGYVEAAYDVLTAWGNPRGQSLTPFLRYERYDTQAGVPNAWRKNPSNSRVEYTVGAGYKPLGQVVFKADHQFLRDQGLTGVGQTNLGIGYIF
ncbi:MAG: hypothetical protein HY928_13920 [Elusimicrobia bacterium]|nr:hypothetical protein [Elusimicrobiota bacterium]